MRAVWYTLAYLIPLTAALGVAFGGWWLAITPLFIFALTPVLDWLVGLDEENLDEGAEEAALASRLYPWVVRAWAPMQLGVIVGGLYRTSVAGSGWEVAGVIIAVGMMGGIGINVAHEMMHRKSRLDRALAEVLMGSVSYTHFCVEHVYGHHKHVATPLDPATARFGETVYAFVPRSVVGGFKSFWAIEGQLAERRGYGRLDLRNRRLRYPLLWALTVMLAGAVFGVMAAGVFVLQGIVAFTLLEVINYLEHYGLERAEVRPGRYERIRPHHSWNSAHRLTNWYLFGLPRHSDHHYLASRPYSILRHHDEAPQLPAGYATMFLVALVPPLWRSVMHPRVEAVRAARVGEQAARSAEVARAA